MAPPLPIPALITLGVVVHVLLVLSIFDIHFQVRAPPGAQCVSGCLGRTCATTLYSGRQRGSGGDTGGAEGYLRAHSPGGTMDEEARTLSQCGRQRGSAGRAANARPASSRPSRRIAGAACGAAARRRRAHEGGSKRIAR